MQENMKAYVMGAGNLFEQYQHLYTDIEILGIIDNSVDKIGKELYGYPVLEPQEAINNYFKGIVDYIFLCSNYYKEMREQLINLNMPEKKIIDKDHLGLFEGLWCSKQYFFNSSLEAQKILMFSHSLDLTGAPIVFCRLAVVLKNLGYNVTVVAEMNSNINHKELFSYLLENRVSVILVPSYLFFDIDKVAEEYDLFWVNTLLLDGIVDVLCKYNKKVYWWLHEAEDIYASKKVHQINDHNCLYVLTVGWLARESFQKYFNHCVFRDLLYGMLPWNSTEHTETYCESKIKIGMIAAYSERKGYDFLVDIIKKNILKWQNKLSFFFVGNIPKEKKDEYKKVGIIEIKGELSQKEISEFYEEIDVLIAPSFFDPMPVVVTEAMQHRKMCIVSNMVGQSKYINNFLNGIIFKTGEQEELSAALEWVVNNPNKVITMGEEGYYIFEKYFSIDTFKNNVELIMKETNYVEGTIS